MYPKEPPCSIPRPAARWPATLWIVRHGESAGNVARDHAHQHGLTRIALTARDVDTPLSSRGEDQARALGAWFSGKDDAHRPDVLLASPYLRAMETARLFRGAGGAASDEPICSDERLREKEFGILDGLTMPGVAEIEPQQAEFRRVLGKFYHRPPGGESWCDVIFRLRSLMDTIALHHAGANVMIVAHQVVVLCLRYVIEGLSEQKILTIDAEGDVANCSVTEYRYSADVGRDGGLQLVSYNITTPVEAQDVTVTDAPDRAVAARG